LGDDLHGTLLWRDGLERHLASRFDEALMLAVAVHPRLVVVDRDLPQVQRLVESLRGDAATRDVSIALFARGPMEDREIQLLAAGANAVLRLPAGPEWDVRLAALLSVAPRRAVRLPVRLEFEARSAMEVVGGTVLNISASGMLVETRARLEVGADLDFSFVLATDAPHLEGSGQVVRVAGPRRFGVRFYGLEGDGQERVRAFVARRRA
jgi:DNA-binding response OmpR family regulator